MINNGTGTPHLTGGTRPPKQRRLMTRLKEVQAIMMASAATNIEAADWVGRMGLALSCWQLQTQ